MTPKDLDSATLLAVVDMLEEDAFLRAGNLEFAASKELYYQANQLRTLATRIEKEKTGGIGE
jgi:hypothetical protein